MRIPPPPQGDQWKPWAERLVSYMTRIRTLLSTRLDSDNPSQDGIILWDRTGYPVVSKNDEFRQIVWPTATHHSSVQPAKLQRPPTRPTPLAGTHRHLTLASRSTLLTTQKLCLRKMAFTCWPLRLNCCPVHLMRKVAGFGPELTA